MRNIKIKNKLKSGGIRSAYDKDINKFTDAKKSLEEIKKAQRAAKQYMKRGGYKSRYQVGGMYGDNTVASAGQGRAGDTSTIVYQESDPQLQEQRLASFESERTALAQESAQTAAEVKAQAEMDEQTLQQQAAIEAQKGEMVGGTISSGLQAGKQMGLIPKEAGSLGLGNAVNAFKAARLAKSGADMTQAAILGAEGGKFVADAAKTGHQVMSSAKTGKTILVDAGGNVVKGGSGLGAGLASAAKNPNVIAAAANVAGKTIRHFSDDDDATTWTTGEATGDILGTAGEYAGYGAMLTSWLGPGAGIGAAVGGIIGAGVGVWKGLTGRRKAKRAEAEAKRKRNIKIGEYNKKLSKRYGAQFSRVRAGETQQKTYSGYDLGRNVVAQMGGMRMGMPRYGYAA